MFNWESLIRFARGTIGEYYLAYNIKNVKMSSYHSIYENASKLKKNWLSFLGLNIYFISNLKFAFKI